MYELKYHDKDLSKSSFLVTGGAGFIGSNFVHHVIKHTDDTVVVLDLPWWRCSGRALRRGFRMPDELPSGCTYSRWQRWRDEEPKARIALHVRRHDRCGAIGRTVVEHHGIVQAAAESEAAVFQVLHLLHEAEGARARDFLEIRGLGEVHRHRLGAALDHRVAEIDREGEAKALVGLEARPEESNSIPTCRGRR